MFNEEILSRLGEATAEELAAALSEIGTQAATFSGDLNQEQHAQFLALAEAAKQVRGEFDRRSRAAAEYASTQALIGELTSLPEPAPEVTPESAPPAPNEGGEPEPEPEVEPEREPAPETNEEEPAEEVGGEEQPEGGDTVTASGRRLGGVGLTTGTGANESRPFRINARVTNPYGDAFSDDPSEARRQIAQQFADVAGQRTRTGKTALVTVNYRDSFREAGRYLERGANAFTVMERMEAVERAARSVAAGDRDAMVAAGICGPVETAYDIPVIGDTDRPVRDALARMGADRGGLTYRPAIDGVLQTGGIGNWTSANDEADPLVPKTCLEVDCPTPVTVEVDAIYQCLTFSNMSTQFDPEFMDSVIQAQGIAFARFAENKLLTQLTNASKTIYTTKFLGAARDAVVALDKIVAYYRSVHRLNDNAPLRHIVPLWMKDLFRADIARQMVGDGLETLAISDEQIEEWFRRRNINITYHLDGIDPADITAPDPDIVVPNQLYSVAAANTEVPEFKDAVSTLLFREGDWKYLDGGELNMGIVRDSVLNSENRFQTFKEEFGTGAHRGIESLHLVYQLSPTGASAATRDTTALED